MSKNRTASIIKIILILVVVLIILGYIVFSSRVFIEGPQIQVETPLNGAKIEGAPLVKIDGKASNIAYFWLNNRQIYTDEDGNFSESLLLYPGYNIIWLTAQDKFGREVKEKLELVY